jgi:site-specific recombinase XerC
VSYRAALVKSGLSRSTVAARLATVSRFFEAAVWRGLRPDNPAAGLKAPKDKTAAEEQVKFLPPDYLTRLLAAYLRSPMGARDRAVALFCLHGPRVTKLVELDLDDMDLVRDPPTVRIRHGKGGKERTLYLATIDARELRAWLAIRPTLAAQSEAALFVTTQANQEGEPGRRVSDRSTRRRIDALLEATGMKREGVSCHSLRHSVGTWSAAAGVPVAAISAVLGHADISTTGIYVKVADRIKQNPAATLEKFMGLAS